MPRTKAATLSAAFTLVACLLAGSSVAAAQQAERAAPTAAEWTRGATCYEVFVRSFFDSDGDGIGDLRGLIQKLDYINDGDPASQRDLGARCIWLMPISPSPSYHGYDVTDYYRVNPDYGTNEDFKELVAEAHKRGIRILVDMVINHSSNDHPYFRHAAVYTDSPWRDWYIWLPEHPGVKNPWGGDNWHRSPEREEYYYGFFWGGMPDLNVENPAVVEELKKIATFWLEEMGVDGFRLDAVKHLVEAEQGRVVEHLPGTHAVLREYGAHVRSVKPEAFTIGEVWDSIEKTMPYYPDQLDAYFAFEVSDAILEAVKTGSAAGLLRPILQLQRALPPDRWSPFLRNHDQTRTLTALDGNVPRAKLAASILLTIPGLPFVYYGEELGMTADKPDPRLRTPMHWSRKPAAGFTTGFPWEPLQPDSMTANVEAQDGDPRSLLNLHRRLIHLRDRHPALAAGDLLPLTASNESVAAFLRREGDRAVLVVANLGTAPLRGISLSSTDQVLPSGRYALTSLIDGPSAAALQIGADGRVRGYVPLRNLGPQEVHILDIATGTRAR